MSLIAIICFLICVGIIISTFVKNADIFSPGRVFTFVWSFGIGLAELKLSYLQHEWSFYAWTILLLGTFSLLIGFFITYILHLSKPLLKVDDIRQHFLKYKINEGRLFAITVVLFLTYLACYALEVKLEGGIPAFSKRPDKARVDFGVFGLHLIVGSMPAILFLIVEYFVLVKRAPIQKIILSVAFFITFASFFLLLQRFSFVFWFLITVPFIYYASSFMKPKYIVIFGIIFLMIIIAIRSVRAVAYIQNYIYVISKMKYPIEYAFLTEPYMYITMNFENFARGVENLEKFTFGYFTSYPVLALSGLKNQIIKYFYMQSNYEFMVSGYNTFIFLWDYYRDFGIIGVVIFPFLIGTVLGFGYYRLRTKPDIFNVTLYSIGLFMLVIWFFTNPLTQLYMIFNIGLLLFINRYLVK
jgi:oligosaccharide repeat unit polymerase